MTTITVNMVAKFPAYSEPFVSVRGWIVVNVALMWWGAALVKERPLDVHR